MTPEQIEIALGVLINAIFISRWGGKIETKIENLTGWVRNVDERGQKTADLAAELKGRVEASLNAK